MARKELTEQVTFKQIWKISEGREPKGVYGEGVPGKKNSKCKHPVASEACHRNVL